MYDAETYRMIATSRAAEFQANGRREALAAIAACCKPSAIGPAVAGAWHRTVAWMRSGQLGPGYVRDCCT